MPDVNDQQP
jgi:ABC-type transporter Mla subunit MlaD